MRNSPKDRSRSTEERSSHRQRCLPSLSLCRFESSICSFFPFCEKQSWDYRLSCTDTRTRLWDPTALFGMAEGKLSGPPPLLAPVHERMEKRTQPCSLGLPLLYHVLGLGLGLLVLIPLYYSSFRDLTVSRTIMSVYYVGLIRRAARRKWKSEKKEKKEVAKE